MIHLSPPVLVGLGGAVGALLRFATTALLDVESFPYGTLAVNIVGSVALGFLTFSGFGGDLLLLVGVGACGSYTTFSSFAYDTVRLVETGHPVRAVVNALGTFLAAVAGIGLARLVVG